MARLAGVDIPDHKPVVVALTYVYGIGNSSAKKICEVTGVKQGTRVKDLLDDEMAKIRAEIEKKYQVEGDARRKVSQNVRLMMDILCYRGLRHRKGLPVRGQRTHTNARTRKGPSKGAIAGKKRAPAPK